MAPTTTTGRTVAAAAVLLGVASATSSPAALAGSLGRAAATQTVTSGSWLVQPVLSGTSPAPGAAVTTTSTVQFLDARNTGTLAVSGVTYAITSTKGTAVLETCSTSWNETTGICTVPGTTTVVATTATTSTAAATPIAASGRLRLRATQTGGGNGSVSTTISTSVSRAQVRAATTAGS